MWTVKVALDRPYTFVVLSLASQFMLRQLPPGTLPPQIINFSASSVPILQIGLSGKNLSEQELNDIATNTVRTQLVTIPGAVVPSPSGGKQRQVTINMDQNAMQSKGIAPGDILNAVSSSVLNTLSGSFQGGVGTYLHVVTWQTAALLNEREEIDLMRRRLDASVLLIKVLGGGWDSPRLTALR
jgi:multidrug efflux pump subunit AcrB